MRTFGRPYDDGLFRPSLGLFAHRPKIKVQHPGIYKGINLIIAYILISIGYAVAGFFHGTWKGGLILVICSFIAVVAGAAGKWSLFFGSKSEKIGAPIAAIFLLALATWLTSDLFVTKAAWPLMWWIWIGFGIGAIFVTKRDGLIEPSEANKKWIKGQLAFERGKIHQIARSDQDALDCFDEAVDCGFESAEVFSLRGSCLQSLDWELDAIEDFTKAISFNPADCNLHFQRAMAKISVGDDIGFKTDLHEAIRLSHLENASNLGHNEGARQMGWPNAAALYEAQTAIADAPEFISLKNSEHAKQRGKRPTTQRGA